MRPPLLPLLHGIVDELGAGALEVHPSVLIGCLALAAGYAYAVGPLARRLEGREVMAERWRAAAWYGALTLVFLALNGPLHEMSDEYLFSAHMGQHMLLMLVVPPLLLLGLPPTPRVRRTSAGGPSASRRCSARRGS
jgi:putative membrane protein